MVVMMTTMTVMMTGMRVLPAVTPLIATLKILKQKLSSMKMLENCMKKTKRD